MIELYLQYAGSEAYHLCNRKTVWLRLKCIKKYLSSPCTPLSLPLSLWSPWGRGNSQSRARSQRVAVCLLSLPLCMSLCAHDTSPSVFLCLFLAVSTALSFSWSAQFLYCEHTWRISPFYSLMFSLSRFRQNVCVVTDAICTVVLLLWVVGWFIFYFSSVVN